MLYPLKFIPVYKDYLWGGRNLEKLGRKLPEGRIAESWEVSAHPDGVSVIANGEAAGITLPEYIEKMGREVLGKTTQAEHIHHFPLLIKLIDANQQLSVQVHPDDAYARSHEAESYGKSELWYIISAKPGARIIYHLKPGVTREHLAQAIQEGCLESCLNSQEVHTGDVINIPAGTLHGLGSGIVLAEIQQNSNATYRVYDYDRRDANGNKRPLHIEKALEVIDFSAAPHQLSPGMTRVTDTPHQVIDRLAETPQFTVEKYRVDGLSNEIMDGSRFYIYTFFEGEGSIRYNGGTLSIHSPESILIPAMLGEYIVEGHLTALRSFIK